MKTVSLHTLRDLLANVRGATPISLLTVTDARLKVKGNPYAPLGSVYKVCRVNAMANTDHESAVNRQQVREHTEPGFQAGERSWGTRHGCLVEHKGEYYLPVQIRHVSRPIYVAPTMRGINVRLVPVAKEVIAPFLPPDRREQEAARQGVEAPVVRRDYKLSSIVAASIGGQRYRVRP